jgi:hypothetical protein
MGDITSSQTLGRGMRDHTLDRTRLRNREIVPNDCYNGKFFKPWCYVVTLDYAAFPDFTKSKIESMVESIYKVLGYIPCETFIDEGYTGTHPVAGPRQPPETYDTPEGYEDKFFCDIVRSLEEKKKQSLINMAKQAYENTITSAKESIKKLFLGL